MKKYIFSASEIPDDGSYSVYESRSFNENSAAVINELFRVEANAAQRHASGRDLSRMIIGDYDEVLRSQRDSLRPGAFSSACAIAIGEELRRNFKNLKWFATDSGMVLLHDGEDTYFDVFGACSSQLNDPQGSFVSVLELFSVELQGGPRTHGPQ